MDMLPTTVALPLLASKLDAGANAAAAVTLTAPSDGYNVIDWVAWSYDGDPTGGKLTIELGSTDFEVDITTGGPGVLKFSENPIVVTKNTAVTLTLAAGGASVTGKLNVGYR